MHFHRVRGGGKARSIMDKQLRFFERVCLPQAPSSPRSHSLPRSWYENRTMGFLRRCIEEKFVTEGIVLRGPAGSGKSALIKVLTEHAKEKKKSVKYKFRMYVQVRSFLDKIFRIGTIGPSSFIPCLLGVQ